MPFLDMKEYIDSSIFENPRGVINLKKEVYDWCQKNLYPMHYSTNYYFEIYFKTSSDMILFKLRWL